MGRVVIRSQVAACRLNSTERRRFVAFAWLFHQMLGYANFSATPLGWITRPSAAKLGSASFIALRDYGHPSSKRSYDCCGG
jgi:hypothetical protein